MGRRGYGRAEGTNAILPRNSRSDELFDCSYRNPTQVGTRKSGKGLERTLVEELGKLAP